MAELVGVLVAASVLLWSTRARRIVPEPTGRPEDATDAAAVLDLIAVAVESGADLPRALTVVGGALGGAAGESLRRVAAGLLWGAPWSAAWAEAPQALRAAQMALEPAWSSGVSAVPALRAAAVEHRQERRRRAREAASRLGVRLVVPLGVCFLPAFVLVGVVPVLMSLAGRLG